MSGFGAIFVFIGVMPVLTNIIVTTTASSNLLAPGVPRLFVSDLCRELQSQPLASGRRFINGINAKLQTQPRSQRGVMHDMNDLSSSPGQQSSALLACITAD